MIITYFLSNLDTLTHKLPKINIIVMKKIIAVAALFTATLLSSNDALAQQRGDTLSKNAKIFTEQLTQEFGINDEQQRDIKNAHMLKERQIMSLRNNSTLNKSDITKKVTAINLEFDNKLKAILTETQYKKYTLALKS